MTAEESLGDIVVSPHRHLNCEAFPPRKGGEKLELKQAGINVSNWEPNLGGKAERSSFPGSRVN